MTTNRHQPPPEMQVALKPLAKLIGEWKIEAMMPLDPPIHASARMSFEWFEEAFVIQRSLADNPDFPKTLAIIGVEEATGMLVQHYFDSRGVTRLYQMSLTEKVWKLWRDDPEFAQRFVGTFSDDGKTITAKWEKSEGGSDWEHDFDMIYTKISG